MTDLEKKWEEILDLIKAEVSTLSYTTWFETAKAYSYNNNTLIISAFAEPYKEKLQDYMLLLLNAAAQVYKKNIKIEIYTEAEIKDPNFQIQTNVSIATHNNFETGLNKKFRFDNFITGPSNKHAVAAAKAVAKNPGTIHNPLFIYGNSGLGKTHLMQAIGNFIHTENPEMRILYISCERFVNELILSIQTTKTDVFREKYRDSVDVLLIDDIQFLINKQSSQDEFFYTFNDLIDYEKQIVIVSDRQPDEFKKDFQERLTTRFSQGVIVDIAPPEFETRAAIINKKAETANINLPYDVSKFIAEAISSNIRVLEGALSKILAYTRLTKEPITLELAEDALKEYINNDEKFRLTLDIIKQAVAEHFNTTVEDINNKGRKKIISEARQVAMFLCRELLNETYENIGKNFNRNYSTVIHAVDNIEKMMNAGVGLSKDVEDIKSKFAK